MLEKLKYLITSTKQTPISISSNLHDNLVAMIYDVCQINNFTISHYDVHKLDIVPVFDNDIVLIENFDELSSGDKTRFIIKMIESSDSKVIFIINNNVEEITKDYAILNKMIHIGNIL